jgi:hypothetical protein
MGGVTFGLAIRPKTIEGRSTRERNSRNSLSGKVLLLMMGSLDDQFGLSGEGQ